MTGHAYRITVGPRTAVTVTLRRRRRSVTLRHRSDEVSLVPLGAIHHRYHDLQQLYGSYACVRACVCVVCVRALTRARAHTAAAAAVASVAMLNDCDVSAGGREGAWIC